MKERDLLSGGFPRSQVWGSEQRVRVFANRGWTRRKFLFFSSIWMRMSKWKHVPVPFIPSCHTQYGNRKSTGWKVGPTRIRLTGARVSPHSGKGGRWQVWWILSQPLLSLQTGQLSRESIWSPGLFLRESTVGESNLPDSGILIFQVYQKLNVNLHEVLHDW